MPPPTSRSVSRLKANTTITLVVFALFVFFSARATWAQTASAPNTIANLALWLHADAGTSTSTNGAAVSTWTDQSTNTFAFTLPGGATAPTLNTTGINNLPALSFSSARLATPANSVFTAMQTSGNYTFIFVFKSSSTGFANTLFAPGVATSKQMFFGFNSVESSPSDGKFFRFGDVAASGTVNDGNAHVVSYTSSVSNGTQTEKIWVDGLLSATRTGGLASADTASVYTVGATSGGFNFAGLYAEAVAYSSTLPDAQRASVELYEGNRYNVSLTQPNNTVPTVGAISLTTSSPTSLTLSAVAAVGGTAPLSYQWYRSATSTTALGTAISGATSLTLVDTPPSLDTLYYYRLRVADSANPANTSTSAPFPAMRYPLSPLALGFIGDSNTDANGPASGKPVTYTAARIAQWNGQQRMVSVVNRGISGTTTANWVSGGGNLNAAKSAFASAGVTHVFVCLGTNDAKSSGQLTASTYLANLSSMVSDLTGAGYKIVLNYPPFAKPGGSEWDETSAAALVSYQASINSLVNGSTVFQGDTRLFDLTGSHPESFGDYVHYSDAGAQTAGYLWASAFEKNVLKVGGYPAAANVRNGVDRGDGTLGTLVLPVASNVLSGIGFGAAGTEFTGTATSGGGSGLTLSQIQAELDARGLTSGRVSKLDNADVLISSRLSTSNFAISPNWYTAPVAAPTASQNAAAVLAAVVDGSLTVKQAMAIQSAIAAGRLSVGALNTTAHTQTTTYYRMDGTTVLSTSTVTFDATNTKGISRTVVFSNLP